MAMECKNDSLCTKGVLENLDYILQRLETRSSEGSEQPSWPSHDTVSQYLSDRALVEPRRACRPCGCGSGRCLLVCLLILLSAWGVAAPLYFIIGPGVYWQIGGTPAPGVDRSALTQQQIERLQMLNGTVLNAVNASFVIVNQRHTYLLSNPYNTEYQSLKLKLETLITVVFHDYKDFGKVTITRFRPTLDSKVLVTFVLIFNRKQSAIRSFSLSRLSAYLSRHWNMLGTFQVEHNSLTVEYVYNRCAVNNFGCSHLCYWSILSSEVECRCPQNYRLLRDGKTCYPAETQAKSTTTVNPCSAEQYPCRSGTCIPRKWLCDDISDCILGEDESASVCDALKAEVWSSTTQQMTTTAVTSPPATAAAPLLQPAQEMILHRPDNTDFTIPSGSGPENGSKLDDHEVLLNPRVKTRHKYIG